MRVVTDVDQDPSLGDAQLNGCTVLIIRTAPRDATRVGPACPQLDAPSYARTSKDCLTLNVWTPVRGSTRKPVLVWIPGGAFVQGSGGYLLYRGARLASREDAVVVTMNYRVGALGFMAHAELAEHRKFKLRWSSWLHREVG